MSKQGWNTAFGVADETTYKTLVAPTRWFEFRSVGLERRIERIKSSAIRYGRLNRSRTGAYSSVDWGAAGPIVLEVPTKGFGFWLKHMMGAVATTGPTSTAYTHTGSIATLTGDSFSAQSLIDGDVRGLAGGKLQGWEISCSVGEILTVSMDAIFAVESEPAAGTPTFVANQRPYTFADGTLTVGGSALGVQSFTLSAAHNLAEEERRTLGATQNEPLETGRDYTGSFTADYTGKATGTPYHRFINGTEGTLTLTFQGPLISGTEYHQIVINAPVMRIDSGSPTVDSPDPVTLESGFEVLDEALTIAYKTTEATP